MVFPAFGTLVAVDVEVLYADVFAFVDDFFVGFLEFEVALAVVEAGLDCGGVEDPAFVDVGQEAQIEGYEYAGEVGAGVPASFRVLAAAPPKTLLPPLMPPLPLLLPAPLLTPVLIFCVGDEVYSELVLHIIALPGQKVQFAQSPPTTL